MTLYLQGFTSWSLLEAEVFLGGEIKTLAPPRGMVHSFHT